MTIGDITRALDACLELMKTDGLDAKSAASRFPDVAEELMEPLEAAAELRALPAIPGPSQEFRSRLAAELAAAPPPRALRGQTRHPTWSRRLVRSLSATVAATAAVVVFMFGGAVYASADDLPGDALYSVKRAVENVRLHLAGDGELELRLAYADRRLAEAAMVPGSAGDLLADFSHEVTAALVQADRAMQGGAPVDEVVPPLISWLLSARAQLVEGQAAHPPTAWRAALALVNEAIEALRSEHARVAPPVPRIADARAVLQSRAPGWLPRLRADVARSDWPIAGGPGVGAGSAPRYSGAGQSEQPADSARGPIAEPALQQNAGGLAPIGPTATSPGVTQPTEPARIPTERPRPSQPEPTQEPTKEPTPTPTPMSIPTQSATREPSPTPTVDDVAPTQTPAGVAVTPSPQPTATESFENRAPVILECVCQPRMVKVYGQSRCEVVAQDPDGDELEYQWTVDAGVMEGSDQPIAYYQAQIRIGGIAKVDIPIHVVVRDQHGAEATQEVIVIVSPRVSKVNEQSEASPGLQPDVALGPSIVKLEQQHAR